MLKFGQRYCSVAEYDGSVMRLYILHPNNIGRCGHLSNASFAADLKCRGKHVGEKPVSDCLVQAKKPGFGILQFNAVVERNVHARHLYERLRFLQIGTVPRGFRMKDGSLENICLYYHELLVSGCGTQKQISEDTHYPKQVRKSDTGNGLRGKP